ncbi:MAG TPA: hypothetical protein ENF22_06640 [Chloroflexi bacterium]|nr:hypothetical protein [Chloroflexota bacterium]
MNLGPLLSKISIQYKLNPDGVHGLSHWARVLENGLRLAEIEGGDLTVISLFAIFHDACRHNQARDPGHGQRGAVLAGELLRGYPGVSPEQLKILQVACRDHTDGETEAELTVQICWDSDRLDLARVHIKPSPARLCTNAAKDKEILAWANHRARSKFSPDYVSSEWLQIFKTHTN